jgi:hypothetical protein
MDMTDSELALRVAHEALGVLSDKLQFLAANTREESLHIPRSLEDAATEMQRQLGVFDGAVNRVRDKLGACPEWMSVAPELGRDLQVFSGTVHRILAVDASCKLRGDAVPPDALDCQLRLRLAARVIRLASRSVDAVRARLPCC